MVLASVKLNNFSQDRLIWKFDKKGVFSVKSVSKLAIAAKVNANEINNFSFTKKVWKGLVPPKVELFSWFVLIGRVNTKDRLCTIGILPEDQVRCCFCQNVTENVEHLFF